MAKPSEPRRRLAVVEDDDDLRLLMVLWLSPFHDCAGFSSGEALLSSIGHLKPELLILDGDLPGASGFEVAAAVRADTKLTPPRIVFLTGLPRPRAEQAVRDCPGATYLTKPVKGKVLQDHVARLLAADRQAL